jgi:mono/diheme cytochrome c family protein
VIRRGVLPDGTSVIVMPADGYSALTDDDTAAVIAYVRAQPPSGETEVVVEETWLKRAMVAFGMAPYQAERLLAQPDMRPPDRGSETARGRSLVTLACVRCHRSDLHGAPAPPFFPQFEVPDLALALRYQPDEFRTLLRAGRALDGGTLFAKGRTAAAFRYFTDAEIDEIRAYLVAYAQASAVASR